MSSKIREFYVLPTNNTQVKLVKNLQNKVLNTEEKQKSTTSTNNESNILSSIESKVDSFISICTGIAQAQTILAQNQEVILTKLSEISAKLDALEEGPSHIDKLNENIIKDEESFEKFENSLKDSKFANEMTKVYSLICGNGKGGVINNAYVLIDAMFDRNFLTQCSWSGGSRTDQSKICFKIYKRVINFFFHILHKSDEHFTMIECENFLKIVLKNAKKRCDTKMLRASCQRKRTKRSTLENALVLLDEAEVVEMDSDSGTEGWEVNE